MSVTSFRCRNCKAAFDGMAISCYRCRAPQRIPIVLADGQLRYLPRGMTLDDFDAFAFIRMPWLGIGADKYGLDV